MVSYECFFIFLRLCWFYFFSRQFILFSNWDAFQQFLIIFKFKFSFYNTFLCLLCFPPSSCFINLITFYFFLLLMASLIHNLKSSFNISCNVFANIICFFHLQWNCLYPYNTVLLFHHILVSLNYTKTHTLLFY